MPFFVSAPVPRDKTWSPIIRQARTTSILSSGATFSLYIPLPPLTFYLIIDRSIINQSIYLHIYRSIDIFFYLSMYLYIYLYIYVYIYWSMFLCIYFHLSIYLSRHQSIRLFFHILVYNHVCISVLMIYTFVCLGRQKNGWFCRKQFWKPFMVCRSLCLWPRSSKYCLGLRGGNTFINTGKLCFLALLTRIPTFFFLSNFSLSLSLYT